VSTTTSFRPRDGSVAGLVPDTTPDAVAAAVERAVVAAPALASVAPGARRVWLRAVADALEVHRGELVALADEETALGVERLTVEVARTAGQLRFYGDVAADGSYLGITVDSATATTPRLVRVNRPLGPVAVFGASNFPFAFSVLGNDTASALAAGCPVVAKAHPAHVRLSVRLAEIATDALTRAGAPEGAFSLVVGHEAGVCLVQSDPVAAVAFTGSQSGGMALWRLANERESVIPVYAEMGTVNPVVVTPAALERLPEIAAGFVGSFTLGAGQFCTKPGLAFVPSGAEGDAVLDAMAEAVRGSAPQTLLNEGIAGSFGRISASLAELPGVETVAEGAAPEGPGFRATPLLLTTSAADLPHEVTEECFGPVAVVARYDDEKELFAALDAMPSSLTATILRGAGETELPLAVSQELRTRAGRLVYDAYPTGVAVSWAQHHGGPWPSTNSQHTSVGTTAIRRFLRPVTWQGAPQELLPEELTDDFQGIPRRIDGVLQLPRG
jgi:NADP-dependent aldehyde dehydrogenase